MEHASPGPSRAPGCKASPGAPPSLECRKNSPAYSGMRYPLGHQCRHAVVRSVIWSRRDNYVLVPLFWHFNLALVMGSISDPCYFTVVLNPVCPYMSVIRFSDSSIPSQSKACGVLLVGAGTLSEPPHCHWKSDISLS